MKYLRLTIIVAAVWACINTLAFAQQPPVQSINPNQVACTAQGSQGPVTTCKPGWSYGCSANQIGSQILATDGNRTSILIQDTGANPIVVAFGDQAAGNNGFIVQPSNSLLWSNLGVGNAPGRVPTSSISVISTGISTCVFLFTN